MTDCRLIRTCRSAVAYQPMFYLLARTIGNSIKIDAAASSLIGPDYNTGSGDKRIGFQQIERQSQMGFGPQR
jgi:hypothetical protein